MLIEITGDTIDVWESHLAKFTSISDIPRDYPSVINLARRDPQTAINLSLEKIIVLLISYPKEEHRSPATIRAFIE